MASIREIANQYRSGGVGHEQGTRNIIHQANLQGLGWDEIAKRTGYGVGDVQAAANQYGLSLSPTYGMQGSEGAINTYTDEGINLLRQGYEFADRNITGGVNNAMGTLANTGQQVNQSLDRGIGYLEPYKQGGPEARQLQLAYSGALGPEAQAQAFEAYRNSPGVDFMVGEGERAITRNAAAMGGSQGGNVMRELMKYGTGVAMQDFGNQFDRLGGLSMQAQQAATGQAGMEGQRANIQTNLGTTGANMQMQGGLSMGQIAANLASRGAQMEQNRGLQIGRDRMQTGRDISSTIADTSSALATLQERLGSGESDILGTGANNIMTLVDRAFSGDANAMEQLGTVLANMSVQGSSQYSGQPFVGFEDPDTLRTLGTVFSGLSGLYDNFTDSGGTSNSTNNPTIGWDEFAAWINAGAPQ